MTSNKTQTRYNPWGDDHPEKVRKNQNDSQIRQAASVLNPVSMLDQLFGKPSQKSASKLENWPAEKAPKPRKSEVLLFHYQKHAESFQQRSENTQIKEIVHRLKEQVVLLEKSNTALTADIAKINVEQLPQRPGVYYIRFFEWLLSLVSQLRAKAEEGRTWLNAMTSKKKKMGYWKMYKKHGTSFGLSGERTLATQSG